MKTKHKKPTNEQILILHAYGQSYQLMQESKRNDDFIRDLEKASGVKYNPPKTKFGK